MSRRVIDRAEWVDYVDAFSRRHVMSHTQIRFRDDAPAKAEVG